MSENFREGINAAYNEDSLFVVDFSSMANVRDVDQVNSFIKFVSDHNVRVAVTRAFYEDYDVVLKSLNDEQREIARKIYNLMSGLNRSGKLLYAADVISPETIIGKLCGKKNVCFVYYKNSEFSELLMRRKNEIRCKAIIIDEAGEMNLYSDKKDIISNSALSMADGVTDDDFFKVSFTPETGAAVRTRDGEMITLGKCIGSGGEGSVYDCSYRSDYVIKIYHHGQLNRLRLTKMLLMEKKQVDYGGICWPEKVVFSENGEPVGYLMRKIRGQPLMSVFDGPDSIAEMYPDWGRAELVRLAIDIMQKIQYLHLFGILIGDLRLNNIVLDEKEIPILIDIDSCQIDSLPCPTGFPDYTPPELQHVEFKKQLRSYYNEDFACAVLAFRLLFCGIHPYDQINGADTIEEDIFALRFPYPPRSRGDLSRIPWGQDGPYSKLWTYTPVQLQSFFYDIFKNGKRYDLQEIILMLKTYLRFIELNGLKKPSINKIKFDI